MPLPAFWHGARLADTDRRSSRGGAASPLRLPAHGLLRADEPEPETTTSRAPKSSPSTEQVGGKPPPGSNDAAGGRPRRVSGAGFVIQHGAEPVRRERILPENRFQEAVKSDRRPVEIGKAPPRKPRERAGHILAPLATPGADANRSNSARAFSAAAVRCSSARTNDARTARGCRWSRSIRLVEPEQAARDGVEAPGDARVRQRPVGGQNGRTPLFPVGAHARLQRNLS